MTRMSDPSARAGGDMSRNSWQSRRGSRLARLVQATVPTVHLLPLTLLTLLGCVVPPSLHPEDYACDNSPPALKSISDRDPLPEPGPVSVARGDTATTFRVSLIDTDVTDTLYVRIFVDYNLPDHLPARVQCTAAPT